MESRTSYLAFIQNIHNSLKENSFDPMNWEIRSIPICNSTMDFAENLINLGYNRVIVLSKEQKQGRGRNKRIWESPEGGIWLSIGVNKECDPIEISTPVVESVESLLKNYVNCYIKEPNDILIDGKKVCGILVEAKIINNKIKQFIIGIGINFSNEIPESIKDIAIRLIDYCSLPNIFDFANDVTISVLSRLKTLNLV